MNWYKTSPWVLLLCLSFFNSASAAPLSRNKVVSDQVLLPHPSELSPKDLKMYAYMGYQEIPAAKEALFLKLKEIYNLEKEGVSIKDEALRRGKANIQLMREQIEAQFMELKFEGLDQTRNAATVMAVFEEDILHFEKKLQAPLRNWTRELIVEISGLQTGNKSKDIQLYEEQILKIFVENIESTLKDADDLFRKMQELQKFLAQELAGNPFEGGDTSRSSSSFYNTLMQDFFPNTMEFGPFEDPGPNAAPRFQAPDKGDGGRDPLELTGKGAPIPPHPRRESLYEEFLEDRADISASVKVKWGPASVEGGTSLEFKRKTAMKVRIFGPGEDAIVQKIIIDKKPIARLNHSKDRRLVYFCEYEAQAVNSLLGTARLKFETPDIPISPVTVRAEASAGAARESGERVQVVQTTLVKYVPILQNSGAETSYLDVIELCRKNFDHYKEKVYAELKLTLSELTYHNTLNQCVKDNHCDKWHGKMIPSIVAWTNPRCIAYKETNPKGEETGGTVNYCRIRTKKFGACPWYKNNKLTSSGMFEYPCDTGLKCVQTYDTSSWNIFEFDKARCE